LQVKILPIYSENGKGHFNHFIDQFNNSLGTRSNIEENNSKLLSKFAKQAGSCCNQGTFAPLWQVLKTSAERLSALHMQVVQKVSDLVKEVNKYSEELHKKHKTVCESQKSLCFVPHSYYYRLKRMNLAHLNQYSQCKM
jgi:hypothetical protein